MVSEARTAQAGDTVQVHYTGKLSDGTVFDSSMGRAPLEFTVGAGEVIPGFEQAVIGMRVGEKKEVVVPAALAYGERSERAVLPVPRSQFPTEIDPQPGTRLVVQRSDGVQIPVVVAEVTESHVMLDANHPLAGRDLTFEIELISAHATA